MANLTTEQELYRWSVLTLDDEPVASIAALEIRPTLPFKQAKQLDRLFVCVGVYVKDAWNPLLGRSFGGWPQPAWNWAPCAQGLTCWLNLAC